MKKLMSAKWVGMISFLLYAAGGFAQSQTILMMDNFNQYPFNAFGLQSISFPTSQIDLQTVSRPQALGLNGNSLEVKYDVTTDTSFCAYASPLPYLDLSAFNYLSFKVKGITTKTYLEIELKSGNQVAKVSLWDYLVGGPTKDWQKVMIPLDAFWGLSARDSVSEFLFVFDNLKSKLNQAPLTGTILVDDILFGSHFPGYVLIDAFSDMSPANATGGNSGYFSQINGSPNYSSQLNCQVFGQDACSMEIMYDHRGADAFGGVYFLLGGGMFGTEKDLGKYDNLLISASAIADSINPGNVLLELKSANTTYKKSITGINTSFQTYQVPFGQFLPTPTQGMAGIRQMAIVFQKNIQQKNHGSLLVDDIMLAATGVTGKDTALPAPFSNLTFSTGGSTDCVLLMNEDSVVVSIEAAASEELLESVRLEFRETCDAPWEILQTWFAPVPTNIQQTLKPGILKGAKSGTYRFVSESFSGTIRESDHFEVVWDKHILASGGLYRQSFDFIQSLRTPKGVYRDAALFAGTPYHPISVSACGQAVIGLCIADTMGWISDAEAQVLQTLSVMAGLDETFRPARNMAGYFRHFIEPESGAQAWDSEFSSIDSGILCAAALFSKSYFSHNDSIAKLADALFQSIDWSKTIQDPVTGGIFREFDKAGNGSEITHPFNEYMIVAWLAKNDYRNNQAADLLWQNHYASPDSLPTSTFQQWTLLTDVPGSFLSGFVPQFCHYLCNPFTTSPAYHQYFLNAQQADKQWWKDSTNYHCSAWGFGAGNSINWASGGYHADDLIRHPGTISSPHTMAGFVPVFPGAIKDLVHLYNDEIGKYVLQDAKQTEVIWRNSSEIPTWRATDIQLVDYATFLFGLASHPSQLGSGFFSTFNNYDFPDNSRPNFSPQFVGLQPFCLKPDSSLIFPLCKFLVDFNHPLHALTLSYSHTGPLTISLDTLNGLLTLSAPANATGNDTLFLDVIDPLNAKGSETVVIQIEPCTVSIDPNSQPGTGLKLEAVPNPFRESVELRMDLLRPQKGKLSIININGKRIRLFEQTVPEKTISWIWDGHDEVGNKVSPGVYFATYYGQETYSTVKLLRK